MVDVETGSGSSSANSLAAVTDADAFWLARRETTYALAWLSQTPEDKEYRLVLASDYFRSASRYRWVGTKKTSTQRFPWPRTNAVERYGAAIADNVIPSGLVDAVCYLAGRLASTGEGPQQLQPDLPRGGRVKTKTVGPISTTYFDGAPSETVIQAVDGLIASLLVSQDVTGAVYLQPNNPAPYVPNAFTLEPEDPSTPWRAP